jgi:hypothetical protein
MMVLVAVPIRAATLARWSANVFERFNALTWPDKELALVPNAIPTNGHKYGPNAQARNQLLDECLRPAHSHVLWLDADLIGAPADLIEQLLAVSARAIVAPMIALEPPGDWFYDTGGFRLNGIGAAPHGPIFPGYAGGVIELESVGTCYLAPADIYRAGARYSVTGNEVEHVSLCAAARVMGYPVYATDAATVTHAYLPAHGEAWH